MNIELLPIGTHDHPEPHVMRWSELEIAAIRSYAQRCVLHDRNRGGQSLHCLSYDIANEAAASDIERCCADVSDDDAGDRPWYDLDRLVFDGDWERANIARAENFLDLAGRLDRRQGNQRIVRIKPIEVQS